MSPKARFGLRGNSLPLLLMPLVVIALHADDKLPQTVDPHTESMFDLIRDLHSNSDNVADRAVKELEARASSEPEAIVRGLTEVLNEPHPKSRKLHEWAAYAIGNIQVGDGNTVRALLYLVNEGSAHSDDADAPSNAAWAIGRIGYIPDKEAVLDTLVEALDRGYDHLREEAAYALGALAPSFEGRQADVAVQALRSALELNAADQTRARDTRVRATAADALGRFAAAADEALPDLVETALDAKSGAQQVVLNAVLRSTTEITVAVRETGDLNLAKELDQDRARLERKYRGTHSLLLTNALNAMQRTSDAIKEHSWWYQFASHWYWSVPATCALLYLIWALFLRLVFLRLWPMRVLRMYEAIPNIDFKIPKLEIPVPLRGFITSWSQYNNRVLDAWVATARNAAMAQIDHLSERDQSLYISVPVELNGRLVPEISVAELQSHCGASSWSIAIVGDGGLGKTTLAYQLGRWAMSEARLTRLSEHIAITVFVEIDNSADLNWVDIEAEVQRQVRNFNGTIRNSSADLCRALMRSRRLVLILDNISESLQVKLAPAISENVRALISTSRTEGKLARHPAALIKPKYIENRTLFRLVDHYLEKYEKELTIREVAQVAEQLRIVLSRTKRCTPLLANIFAQHLINFASEPASEEEVPSIPGLFVGYVRFLNRHRKDYDSEMVYAAAALAASKCVEKSWVPSSASKSEVRSALSGAQMDAGLLDHLEQLGITRSMRANDRFVFSIDTVAEYLAADYLLQNIQGKRDWREWLAKLRNAPGGPQRIKEFLFAIRENIASRVRSRQTTLPVEMLLSDIDALIAAGTAGEAHNPGSKVVAPNAPVQ